MSNKITPDFKMNFTDAYLGKAIDQGIFDNNNNVIANPSQVIRFFEKWANDLLEVICLEFEVKELNLKAEFLDKESKALGRETNALKVALSLIEQIRKNDDNYKLQLKEVAKNVRHRACEINNDVLYNNKTMQFEDVVNKANREIMNIQLKEVMPKKEKAKEEI